MDWKRVRMAECRTWNIESKSSENQSLQSNLNSNIVNRNSNSHHDTTPCTPKELPLPHKDVPVRISIDYKVAGIRKASITLYLNCTTLLTAALSLYYKTNHLACTSGLSSVPSPWITPYTARSSASYSTSSLLSDGAASAGSVAFCPPCSLLDLPRPWGPLSGPGKLWALNCKLLSLAWVPADIRAHVRSNTTACLNITCSSWVRISPPEVCELHTFKSLLSPRCLGI